MALTFNYKMNNGPEREINNDSINIPSYFNKFREYTGTLFDLNITPEDYPLLQKASMEYALFTHFASNKENDSALNQLKAYQISLAEFIAHLAKDRVRSPQNNPNIKKVVDSLKSFSDDLFQQYEVFAKTKPVPGK